MPKPKVLIVEDSKSISLFLKKIMEKDFEVVQAFDGEDGLNKAREMKPDLMLLDVMLPKMDGFTICRLLKFDDEYKNIPIIMQTSRGTELDKKIGKETGADVYLVKPIEEKDLQAAVNKLVGEKIKASQIEPGSVV